MQVDYEVEVEHFAPSSVLRTQVVVVASPVVQPKFAYSHLTLVVNIIEEQELN